MSRHKRNTPGVGDLFGDESDGEQPQQDAKRPRSQPSGNVIPATALQIDPQVQEVADKLADFVAKNGRHYEDMTRDRNPGNTPFKFLWDRLSKEYKYYEGQLNALLQASGKPPAASSAGGQPSGRDRQDSHRHSSSSYPPAQGSHQHEQLQQRDSYGGSHRSSSSSDRHHGSSDRYHSASDRFARSSDRHNSSSDRHRSSERYEGGSSHLEDRQHSNGSEQGRKRSRWETGSSGNSAAVAAGAAGTGAPAAGSTRTLSAMDEYMRKLDEAARQKQREEEEEEEERKRRAAMPLLKETAFDRRKVVAVYTDDGRRGHHMDDFIPKEELAKFMSKCGDNKLQQQVEAQTAIGADNIGHKLLQKMGWKEGKGIGAKETGQTAPVAVAAAAAGMKQDTLGLGAQAHGAVEESDDPFEQYRKRMMLGYKYRPNPLGNPRRPYY